MMSEELAIDSNDIKNIKINQDQICLADTLADEDNHATPEELNQQEEFFDILKYCEGNNYEAVNAFNRSFANTKRPNQE